MARQLDITIIDARLNRIFDTLKNNQDLFVRLVGVYEDGRELELCKTDVCKNGNLNPRWNERIVLSRGRGGRLKFQVYVDHLVRQPVLCGEAEYNLDALLGKASAKSQQIPVRLFKKEEETGCLNILIGTKVADARVHRAAAPAEGAAGAQPAASEALAPSLRGLAASGLRPVAPAPLTAGASPATTGYATAAGGYTTAAGGYMPAGWVPSQYTTAVAPRQQPYGGASLGGPATTSTGFGALPLGMTDAAPAADPRGYRGARPPPPMAAAQASAPQRAHGRPSNPQAVAAEARDPASPSAAAAAAGRYPQPLPPPQQPAQCGHAPAYRVAPPPPPPGRGGPGSPGGVTIRYDGLVPPPARGGPGSPGGVTMRYDGLAPSAAQPQTAQLPQASIPVVATAGGVVPSAASGQWWNSFIDRG